MRTMWTKRLPGLVALLSLAVVLAPVTAAHAMANGGGAVTVAVVKYCNTAALADVAVELVNIETAEIVASTNTDVQGAASFSDVPFGLYQLRATANGMVDTSSPLVPVMEARAPMVVTLEMQDQGEPCSCDENDPAYDEDCECAEGAIVGVIGAAAGFTFLGLGGGAAVAALIGVVGAAVGAGIGISNAVSDDSP